MTLVRSKMFIALLSLFWLLSSAVNASSEGAVFIQPDLEDRLASGEQIDLLLHFGNMPDLDRAYELDWIERGRWVHKVLSATAAETQREAIKLMEHSRADYDSLWMGNMMIVRDADHSLFTELTATRGVERVYEKPEFELMPEGEMQPAEAIASVTANLEQIRATDAWDQLGFRGEGIVVGLNDSSPRYTHELLSPSYRGNQGGGSYDHNYNWFDPNTGSSAPFPESHGTLVQSIMTGATEDEDSIAGVAPDAKWMACGGCAGGSCAGVYQCLEWMLAPTDLNNENPDPDQRAHIVNNSWGSCTTTYDSSLEPLWDTMYAAGVMPFFANGNSSNCGYSSPPGLNTVGNPARGGRVMGIGSTTQTGGNYAFHSNWGPTDNDNPGLPNSFDHFGYPDLKPNVSAPGQGIPGASSASDTGTTSSTGTSFASPHAAGAAAVMMSAAPCLVGDHVAIGSIMMETAVWVEYTGGPDDPDVEPGVNHPNYASGWGEIDVFAATQMAMEQCGPRGTLTGDVVDDVSGNPIAGVSIETEDAEGNTLTAETDASGFFSMSLPATEGGFTYDIEFSRNGYETLLVTDLEIDEDETVNLFIELEPMAGEDISGAITDANFPGDGVEASILATDEDGFTYGPVTSDDVTGDYLIELPAGVEYTLTVSAAGYETAERDIGEVTGPMTEDFELNAGIIALPATAELSVPRGATGSTSITIENTGTADAEITLGVGGPGALLFEDFEGDFPPAGWDVTNDGDCPWETTDDLGMPGWVGDFRAAAADSDACGSGSNSDTSLITPSFSLEGATMAEVNFDMGIRSLSNTIVDLDISIDGGSWMNIDSWVAEDVAYPDEAVDPFTYDLGNWAGESDVRLRWRYQAGWDWWVVVDNVEVTSDFAGVPWIDIVPSTVTVPEGSSVDVDLVVDASDLAADTYNVPVVVTSGSAYEVDETDFEVTVEPVPEIVLPETVEMTVEFPTTESQTITVENIGGADGELTLTFMPDPLIEDFEEDPFPPEGWVVTDDGSTSCPWLTTDDYPMPGFDGPVAGSTRGAAVDSDSCGIGASVDTSMVSPTVDLSSPVPATLEFDLSVRDFGGTTFTIEATTDGGDTWQVLETWAGEVGYPGDPVRASVDMSPMSGNSEVQVRFRYVSGWDWWVYVDNIELELPAADWAEADPAVFMVDAEGSAETDVVVDSSLLDGPGTYTATMFGMVDSPIGIAPSELIVTVVPGADLAGIQGTVTTQGYCDGNPDIAPGAEITVTGATETWTTFADENGDYIIYVPSDEEFVDVTASAANHIAFTEEDVELVEASEVTVNFDLLLDEPCIDTDPAEFSATMEPNETDVQVLTISNDGAGELTWTIDATDPTVVTPRDGNAGAGVGPASAAGAMDIAGLFDGELPSVRGLSPFTLIDCEDAPGLVISDDGVIENGYSGNPAVAAEVTVVQGYEADGQRLLGVVCVSFLSLGPDSRDYEIVVFDSDGPGGAPGTELGSVSGTATGIPTGLPDPGDPITWYTLDLGPLNIMLEDGAEVYIGARWETSDPNVFMASDEEGPGGNTGFFQTDGGEWSQLGVDAFEDYQAIFVRPQLLSPSGCDAINEVPWLSFDPDAGTTAAYSSSEADVIIDSTGLFPGEYEATVCVFSNDAIGGIQAIPVSLTVEAPESFATITGQVQSAGYCDEDPFPAAGATVVVEGQDNTYTVIADADGNYMVALDASESPVDITASAPQHLDGVESGVALEEGGEYVVDFELTLEAGCTSNDPDSFDVSVALDGSTTEILTLINDGAGDSTFSLSSVEFAELAELELETFGHPGADRSDDASTRSGSIGPIEPSIRSVTVSAPRNEINVLVISPDTTPPTNLSTALDGFADVNADLFTGDLASFTVADLDGYDVAVTTNNNRWSDAGGQTTVGDALADFVDAGGAVVLHNFAWDWFGFELGGRYMSEEYGPFNMPTADATGMVSMEILDPDHPIFEGVSSLSSDTIRVNVTPQSDATLIAEWSDGEALIAHNDYAVGIGAMYSDNGADAWSGDLDLIVYNAVRFIAGAGGAPAEWLSFDPETGSVTAGGSTNVNVMFDAEGLAAGTYEADIIVEVDEGAGEATTLTVPVTMEVMDQDPPVIDVDPLSLSAELSEGDSDVQSITISNQGEASLSWSIDDSGACELPGWASADPMSGSVGQGDSDMVDVTFDATGLTPGEYDAILCVDSNDSASGTVEVELSLTVAETEAMLDGVVISLGYCGADPQPAAGAGILVEGQNNTYTATTDASGYFSLSIPVDESPVDVTASLSGHLPGMATEVVLVGGESTTVDLDLVLEAACATVMPEAMDFTLPADASADDVLTIGNVDGAAALTWSLASGNGCFDGSEGWLSVSMTGDKVAAGESQSVDVTADSSGLDAGVYETVLCIETSDDQQSEVQVPVTLEVQEPGIFQDRFEAQD
jgi:hypothetical protein